MRLPLLTFVALSAIGAAEPPDYEKLVTSVLDVVTKQDVFESSGLHLQAQLADVPGLQRERGSCAPDLTVPNPDPLAPTPYLLSVTMNASDCQTAPSFQSLNLVIPGKHPEFVAVIKPRIEAAYGPVAEVVDRGPAVFYRWHPGKLDNLSLLVDQGSATNPAMISLLAVHLPKE